jgi:hypothetical protein
MKKIDVSVGDLLARPNTRLKWLVVSKQKIDGIDSGYATMFELSSNTFCFSSLNVLDDVEFVYKEHS